MTARSLTTRSTTRPTQYTRLYNRTIDSVVEISVTTETGRQSQGSGFVYSSRGYIVTNQHVVGGAEEVLVRFRDGQWRVGTVVGTDVYTDLAVIRVASLPAGVDALPVARHSPRPGQRVVALGSPFGYQGSITAGIVSGVNRSMPTARGFSIPATIQTDAPINPGNSGGPLVAMDGTVIGVTRAKRGDNVGFAISAAVVRRVVPSLIETGAYRHSYLGIRTAPVTPRVAAATDLAVQQGVMVVGVVPEGPAAGRLQAGELVRTDVGTIPANGDVILRIDGVRIRSQQTLARYLLLQTRPGDRVQLTVIRDGTRQTVTLSLGRRPELRVRGQV